MNSTYAGIAIVFSLIAYVAIHFFPVDPVGSIVAIVVVGALVPAMIKAGREQQSAREARENAFRPGFVDVDLLSPIQYEHYCAELLTQAGWKARVTPPQDQGADILAELRGFRLVVQCKKYQNRVGNAAVQEVIGSKAHYRAQVAAVVCLNGYTKSAHALAKSNGVHLIHHNQLSTLEKIAKIP
jgi:HJR/Mrr/RecB family endonuclease